MTTGGAVAPRRGIAVNPGTTPAPVNMLATIPEEFLSQSFEQPANHQASEDEILKIFR
jgi:hypothetical protein